MFRLWCCCVLLAGLVSGSPSLNLNVTVLPRGQCEPKCKLGNVTITGSYYGSFHSMCISCYASPNYCSCLGGNPFDSRECPTDQSGWDQFVQNVTATAQKRVRDEAIANGQISFSFVPPFAPFAIQSEPCPCVLGDNVINGTFYGEYDSKCMSCEGCVCGQAPVPENDNCPSNEDSWAEYLQTLLI